MSASHLTISRVVAAGGLLLAVASCTPSIPKEPSPASVVSAVFDPAASDIPLPNQLVFQALPSMPPSAQKDLLTVFQAQGGFPNDQEVPVTISFARDLVNADGSLTRVAPTIDPASFTPDTFFVFGATSGGTVQGEIEVDPIVAGDLTVGPSASGGGEVTTLTLHQKGRAPWAPGQYAVLVRGGNDGVKTVEGDPVWPSSVFFLVAQGQDMTRPENLMLLQAQTGSYDAALALATQLNAIIDGYGPAFAACNQRFPHQELASLVGFTVAPAQTQVDLDPGRGLVPLPIDLLRDPRPASTSCAACGKLTPLAACTLASGTIDPATGACSSAAAAGFAALDGFSTTAPILAPANDLVQSATVTASTYRLYDLTDPASPVLVDPASYMIEPVEFTQSGLSPVVASQPVGATSSDPLSPFTSRPLKDDTSYAVVITKGVKDKTGKPLGIGTVGNILIFDHPLVDAGGHSQLQGVDDATAGALEVMRSQLVPVRAALATATPAVAKLDIAMAYTFKTQSFRLQAAQLGAMPYTMPAATGAPGAVTSLSPAAAFAKYGVDPDLAPSINIQEILETDITTFNLLDPVSGAFNPAGPADETIHVLISVPKTAPACAGAMAGFTAAGKTCAPLMVFRHGLGGGRADMLTVADTYASRGMVTVAIDAAKHGDRAYCISGQSTYTIPGVGPVPQCAVGTCAAVPGFTAQGDSSIPGRCTVGGTSGDGVPVRRNVMSSATCAIPGTCGIPVFSSNYVVSANFFRTRDTFRQDIIDQSQLVRAIAFAPEGLPPTSHTVFDFMFGTLGTPGVIIDPAQVYYSGQSLGAIQGAVNVAANPRFSKAVLNVGGGTLVDIFTTSPAFADGTNALLAGMGIAPGTSAYLQFLAVAKLILDPADPVNYAGHLTGDTLPNLFLPPNGNRNGLVPQDAKKVLTQAALCDQVVPNTWSYVLDANAGTGPLPGFPGFGTDAGTFQLFAAPGSDPTTIGEAITACGVPGVTTDHAVEHGFFTDWANDVMTLAAQTAAADFVVSDTAPPSLVVLP
jgi:hypothetical protein